MPRSRWTVRLTAAAEADMRDIFAWTAEHFGIEQARRYRSTILAALRDVSDGPDAIGARERPDIRPNLRSLHIARRGRRGRHVILFTASEDNPQIRIIRILHDSMDLARHLPAGSDEG
jgi:toxin ParE1/3/4